VQAAVGAVLHDDGKTLRKVADTKKEHDVRVSQGAEKTRFGIDACARFREGDFLDGNSKTVVLAAVHDACASEVE
jgi:hypothetical protein